MSLPPVQPLADRIRSTLKPERFLHTLGVLHAAAVYADAVGVEPELAALAAILHDGSKEIPPSEIEADLKRRGMEIPAEDRATPATWHGLHAAVRLRDELPWPDADTGARVARAVELHSTADADMDALARVVFLADALEPGRDFPGVDELRRAALADPDDGFRRTLHHKCDYIAARGLPLHPRAARARAFYDQEGSTH